MKEKPRYRRTGVVRGRYDFDPPKDARWAEKSAYMLRRWLPEQVGMLEAFGLVSSLPRGKVAAFLRSVAPQPRSIGARLKEEDAGAHKLPLGHGLDVLVFSPEHGALHRLEVTAGMVADDLHITTWDAILYLLADADVMVPWLSIETTPGPIGPGFTVRVGSAGVTAEYLREAYIEVKRQELGVQVPRQIKVDDIALYLSEVKSRELGLTWERSWERWGAEAEQIGANSYQDVVAYRNKVNDLRRRFDWVKEDLDRMRRPTGRPKRESGKEGGRT
jgi:hypothetical protein